MKTSTSIILGNPQQEVITSIRVITQHWGVQKSFLIFGPLCTQVSVEMLLAQVHVVFLVQEATLCAILCSEILGSTCLGAPHNDFSKNFYFLEVPVFQNTQSISSSQSRISPPYLIPSESILPFLFTLN